MTTIGVLHPGTMGSAVAAQVRHGGTEVLWCPAGRSLRTKERALRYGLTAVRDLSELTERAEIILSVCPPACAEDVAAAVAANSFRGIYVDGNAIAPASMARIYAVLGPAGAAVVDGSIVGSPPSGSKSTRLYLSGPPNVLMPVASLFAGSAVQAHLLPGGIGRASALKLSYSSYQKATRVLAAVSYALARDYEVEEELLDIARSRAGSYLTETDYIPKTAARSWRWGPEMEEVAGILEEVGLPSDLARAASAIMDRWEGFKDVPPEPSEALDQLHNVGEGPR